MEYRQLSRSGLTVPVLSFGTGTFGGTNEFCKRFGDTDVKAATRRIVGSSKKSIDKNQLRVYARNMANTRVPSELMAIPQCVGMNLRRAARLVTQWYDHVLKPTGLKGTQFGLLFAIHWAGQPTFTPLARKMGMDRTTLARNLQVLQRRKLLRIAEGKDRRQQVITLTAKGQEALTEAIPYWKKAQARAVALLKEDRWKAMAEALQTIERLMEER